MDDDDLLEKTIEIGGNEHKYQYVILLFALLIWIHTNLVIITLPYLEKQPEVNFIDPITHQNITTQLNYTICSDIKDYTITKVYGHSWVSEFGIECSQFENTLLGTLIYVGSTSGCLIFPLLSDKIGRRKSIILGLLGYSVLILLSIVIKNYYAILILTSISQIFNTISTYIVYMLIEEILSGKLRSMFGAIINCGYNVCGFIYIPLYEYLDGWRIVFLISGASTLVTLLFFYLYSKESPKYYILKKDFKRFLKSIRQLADKNHRATIFDKFYLAEEEHLREKFCQLTHTSNLSKSFIQSNTEELIQPSGDDQLDQLIQIDQIESFSDTKAPALKKAHKLLSKKDDNMFKELTEKQYSALDLIRYKSQRNKFLTLCIFWFFTSSNYFGVSYNLKNNEGDMYLIGILMNVVDISAYLFGGIVANYFGRKNTILSFLTIAIIIYGLFTFILTLSNLETNILFFIARFAISTTANVLYTYTFELYPTVIRSYGFGYNTLIGGIGSSFLIPAVVEFVPAYINLIFMVMNMCSFICVLSLPTTLNKPLPDFIPELVIHKDVKLSTSIKTKPNDPNNQVNPIISVVSIAAVRDISNSPFKFNNSNDNTNSDLFRSPTKFYANEV